jgi:hypothetical protein
MRFFLAPLLFAAGILIMKYSVAITDQFSGKIDFAEKYLGTGIGAGTYTWWRLFGLAMCVLAVLWFFNRLPSGPATAPPEPAAMIIRMMI